MRIDTVNRIYETYQTQTAANIKKQEKVTSKDEVTFSSEAKKFAEVKKMLSDVPDVRWDKVNEIKERMASGNYNVKAEEVAEKILSQFEARG